MAFALFGERNSEDLSGVGGVGRVIFFKTYVPSVGHMPALSNADWIFFSVNALSQDLLNFGQKKAFVIAICPPDSFIIWSSSNE